MLRLHHVSELHCRDALLVGLNYVFKLPCHDLYLVGLRVSFKYQIKHQTILVLRKQEELFRLVEILLHLKASSYINNICNIHCVDL